MVSEIARKDLNFIKSSVFDIKEVLKSGGSDFFVVEKACFDEWIKIEVKQVLYTEIYSELVQIHLTFQYRGGEYLWKEYNNCQLKSLNV